MNGVPELICWSIVLEDGVEDATLLLLLLPLLLLLLLPLLLPLLLLLLLLLPPNGIDGAMDGEDGAAPGNVFAGELDKGDVRLQR